MRIEILEGPFEGWVIYDGLLWTPEGDGYSPGDIRAIQYQRELVRELNRQLRQHWQSQPLNFIAGSQLPLTAETA